MAESKFVLKIYSLSHPLAASEMISLLGDKYAHALSFDIALTDEMKEASVIAWDGAVSVKLKRLMPVIAQALQGKVLLLMGESQTFFKGHPLIEVMELPEEQTVQLTGWSVLPEEILAALEICYQKIKHV